MKRFFSLWRPAAVLALGFAAGLLPARAEPADEAMDEIVVTADFRDRVAADVPVSLSVIDAERVEALAVQHFEELTGVVPNLNWSGDGHRARYFQIRGVGELEQYQGAPNPSVGFLIDDIDFSGIGTIATLFDIGRVEILRGPQGSRYGANALAGLIYMQSVEPSADRNGRLRVSAAGDDAYSAGLAFGGSLTSGDRALFRLSAHRHQGNGFRDNPFLGRNDTNGREETTLRGRLKLALSDSTDVRLAMLYADVDDGYDAFALDNSYTTLSDKPGRDAQQSVGVALRIDWHGPLTVTSISTLAESDIDFGFDADWGNESSWAPVTYDYTSASDRMRRTLSQEIRLASGGPEGFGWLAGLYAQRLADDLETTNRGEYYDPFYDFADSLDDTLASRFDAATFAAFGRIDMPLGGSTRLSAGLRVERREADYEDSTGLTTAPAETMAGGEIALHRDITAGLAGYVSLSRGYKAGGFNLGAVPAGRREFAEESMWNLEAGVKSRWRDGSLAFDAAIFVSRREDQQVRSSFQLVPGDPASFVFFTDNAAAGETIGAEVEVRWQIDEAWQAYAAIGLLDADFDEFVTPQLDLSGRGQAHAPRYTFAAGADYRHPSGFFARVDVSGKDAFYFDVSHDRKSSPYELVNARIGMERGRWSAQLWVRNLLDTRYAVRGFFFGNEPPDFPATLYTRLGDPRQAGITLDWRF